MITIIAGTNRVDSKTSKIANNIHSELMKLTEEEVKILSLSDIDFSSITSNSYEQQPFSIQKISVSYLMPARLFIFVIPEYNGSFPGVLKLFIDLVSTQNLEMTFSNKKAALIGTAEGRAGNLMGLNHFAAILQHMGLFIMTKNLPISNVSNQIDEHGKLNNRTRNIVVKRLSQLLERELYLKRIV
ncbi:NADPH-dependent FMN reductase [Aquimarina sp. 2304DJ70-9]|uniref:NADPH-dependent FMN reductase n=1 Tax=Aquimarina penaris TaxID=3231044 RepID=UPI003461D29C